jgi:hypothetical protein
VTHELSYPKDAVVMAELAIHAVFFAALQRRECPAQDRA